MSSVCGLSFLYGPSVELCLCGDCISFKHKSRENLRGRFGEFRFESVVPPPFLRRMANYITKDIKDLVIVLDSDEGPVA